MDYEESVAYMSGLIRFGWKLGNERMEALCDRLGNPQKRYKIVHIAGTKGKGSTTALTAAILSEHGFRVGGYYSPYVYDLRERIQIDGEHIPERDFARTVTEIRPHIEALAQTDLGQTTEFELKTMAALLYFAQREVDFACMEVGIGGRLDATNVESPAVSVITNIGLDHVEILGDTHAKIAYEKAGIIKRGVPCITAADNPEAFAVIEAVAAERCAPLTVVRRDDAVIPAGHDGVAWSPGAVPWSETENPPASQRDFESVTQFDPTPDALLEFGTVTIRTPQARYGDLRLALMGAPQRINAACAVAAVEIALTAAGRHVDVSAVRRALSNARLPGRLTVTPIRTGALVVLDGAHNAMSAAALSKTIGEMRRPGTTKELRLAVGMVGGHSPDDVLAELAPDAAAIYACSPNWKRAQSAETIAAAARRYCESVRIASSVGDAVKMAAVNSNDQTVILVTGSFYTVGEALHWLEHSGLIEIA